MKTIRIVATIILILFATVIYALDLTTEEQQWLEAHPEITFGIGKDWAPFIFPDKNGNHKGFDIDMIKRINELTGAHIQIVPGVWSEIVQRAQERELDGLCESAVSKERSQYFNFTEVYNTQYYTLVTTPAKLSSIQSSEDLKDKIIAYLKGNSWLEKLLLNFPKIQTIPVNIENDGINLVIEGKADAAFVTLGSYPVFRQTYQDNISIAYVFDDAEYKLDLVYSIRKDWPELVSIINKALDEIELAEKNRLYERWVGVSKADLIPWTQLTVAEQEWLQAHPVIRIAPDPGTPPIEWFDENGEYKGITADYMNLMSEELGVEFKIVHCETWEEVLQKARSREVDLIPAAAQTPERAEYMLFSEPYLIFPGVILTRTENQNLTTTDKLVGKNVGMVSGYVWHELLSEEYPEIEIIPVDHITSGLSKLSTGEIDAYIGILPIALYYIEKEGIHNLVVAGETDYDTRISVHIRKDWPILHSIIQKTLNSIPDNKREEILHNWIHIRGRPIVSTRIFWIIILAMFIVAGIIFTIISTWNRSLKKQVFQTTIKLEEDFKKRIEAEKQLRESEERWQFAIDGSGLGLWDWKVQKEKVFYSQQWKAMLGYNEDEIENNLEEWDKRVHPDDKATVYDDLNDHFEGKTPLYLNEHRVRCKDGTYKWILNRGKVVEWDAEGKPLRMIGTHTDVTERKKVEQELHTYREKLEQIVKSRTEELASRNEELNESRKALMYLMEDMNETHEKLRKANQKLEESNKELESFSYSVSHDLRAPLRAIVGFTKILEEDYLDKLDKEGKRILSVIIDNTRNMDLLINDLLQFSRMGKQTINLEEVDTKELAHSLLKGLMLNTERKIECKNNIRHVVMADRVLISQVLENLLSNAIKFTKNKKNPVITLRSEETEENVILSIQDNGVGFDQKYAPKMFEVFQRLHAATEFEGTGIGLAIVKKIVEKHNGSVWAEGEEGRGATIFFSIPKK